MPILANDYGTAVCKALGVEPKNVRRVVVDATAGEALRVYIDYFGGPELLDIQLPTSEVEVKVINDKANDI